MSTAEAPGVRTKSDFTQGSTGDTLIRRLLKSRVRLVVGGLILVVGAIAFTKWKQVSSDGGQQPVEPFRIAGNLYFVGTNDVSAFLLTGPAGHILLDGGYPGSASLIVASIAQLGFDIRDVKVLLNSDPHTDHAGALAALKEASGAELWASEPSAYSLASGGDDPDILLPLRLLLRARIIGYPRVAVDQRFSDGETISVGPLRITAHVTGGHTRGCTSYSFQVQDDAEALDVVSACSLGILGVSKYPEQEADLERSLRVLRSLPVDVWVTSHNHLWGRYRKFAARDSADRAVAPFIDPAGYRAYLDTAEARFRRGDDL